MGGSPRVEDDSLEVAQLQAAEAERVRQQERADLEERRQRFGTAVSEGRAAGSTYARDELIRRGLDPDRYMSPLEMELDRIRTTIPDLDPNPGSYFARPDWISGVLDREQSFTRDRNTRNVNDLFAPNFERSAIADTFDDDVLNRVLNSQYEGAQGTLQRARARGSLNDAGYNAALQRLNTDREGARSTLTGLGDSVLGRYRDDLRGIRDEAYSSGSGWNLGQSDWSIDPYRSRYNERLGQFGQSLEGDINSAVGSTQLFDIGRILGEGGMAQGPQNTRENPDSMVMSVLQGDQQRRRRTSDRGVGSTGVF